MFLLYDYNLDENSASQISAGKKWTSSISVSWDNHHLSSVIWSSL